MLKDLGKKLGNRPTIGIMKGKQFIFFFLGDKQSTWDELGGWGGGGEGCLGLGDDKSVGVEQE